MLQPEGDAETDRRQRLKGVTQSPPGMTAGVGSRTGIACQQLNASPRAPGLVGYQDIDFAPISDDESIPSPIARHGVQNDAAYRIDPDRGQAVRHSRPGDPCGPAVECNVEPAFVSKVTQMNCKSQPIQCVRAIESCLAFE